MIGIFDSGLGGLTILKTLTDKLPEYDYVYFGDNARAPYGNKSQETIFEYTKQALDFLFKKDCQLVIIACNTASAEALRKIQIEWLPENYPEKKVLGVLVPAVESVCEKYVNFFDEKKVGVIATESTINSGKYEKEIKKIDSSIKVISVATPLLVPLVEAGWEDKEETKKILEEYLEIFKKEKVQNLILGCTHYPFLHKQIKNILGKKINIINTPNSVAKRLMRYLEKHQEIKNKLSKSGKRIFYTSDDKEKFKTLGEKFLNSTINNLEKTIF